MTAKQNNDQPENPPEENRAQRSARLEVEATKLMNNTPEDPLAPEPEHYPEEESDNVEHLEPESAQDTDAANEEILKLATELATAKDQVLRMAAEMENVRKRAQKEREDSKKFAISAFAREQLAVSDNLRRALESVTPDMLETEPKLKNLTDGIEATERELLRSFEKNGIEKIMPIDEPFNPNFHEVMFETPGTGKPAGTIIQVMEAGYSINGRLLRPARVGVAKNEDQGSASPNDGPHSVDTEA